MLWLDAIEDNLERFAVFPYSAYIFRHTGIRIQCRPRSYATRHNAACDQGLHCLLIQPAFLTKSTCRKMKFGRSMVRRYVVRIFSVSGMRHAKHVFEQMQTAKTQISLRSLIAHPRNLTWLSMSANRVVGYYRIYE